MQSKTIVTAAAVALIGAVAVAGVTQASGWKEKRHHGGYYGQHHGEGYGRAGGRHQGRHFEKLLDTYDGNEDGKLTQAEIDDGRAEQLAKFDSNKDGKLTLAEYEALWMDHMRERMVDRFQRLDDDGNAEVTLEEFKKPLSRMVARRDRNEDDAISREDFQRRQMRRDRDDD